MHVPWGRHETLALGLPAHWPMPQSSVPNLSAPLAGYPHALGLALDRPVDSPRLQELAQCGMKVAIVVDDPSRWTPVREALPHVLSRLRQVGVGDEDISISVGVGRHHAVDDAAMAERVGPENVRTFRCHSPPVDDLSAYADLGTTPEGVPVRVFRPVAEADLRVLIGSVLPHLQAGFGGGYKLVFPGCSHRSTLGALHRQGLGKGLHDAARLLGGDVATNPMRVAIRHAATRLPGSFFSISHALGPPGCVLRVAAGDVDRVQLELAREVQARFQAPAEPRAEVVIAGNHPWPGDPMQSFKVLLNHRAAAQPRGVLVGLFWTDPAEIDRSFPLPSLKTIASTGAVGGWVIRRGLRLADRAASAVKSRGRFMVRWARELVADRTVLVYSPDLRARLGSRLGPVYLFDDLAPLWRQVERALRHTPRSVRVFPSGGLTYCASSV